MKMFLVSVIGKFSLNTLNKPSIFRLSGVVSNWKNSLKDWICTSSRSGVSARCLIFPKLILGVSFVEDIWYISCFKCSNYSSRENKKMPCEFIEFPTHWLIAFYVALNSYSLIDNTNGRQS